MKRIVLTVAVLAAGGAVSAKEAKEMKKVDVKHWHGAAPDSWFSHLAFEVPGENCRTDWQEPVSDVDYCKVK